MQHLARAERADGAVFVIDAIHHVVSAGAVYLIGARPNRDQLAHPVAGHDLDRKRVAGQGRVRRHRAAKLKARLPLVGAPMKHPVFRDVRRQLPPPLRPLAVKVQSRRGTAVRNRFHTGKHRGHLQRRRRADRLPSDGRTVGVVKTSHDLLERARTYRRGTTRNRVAKEGQDAHVKEPSDPPRRGMNVRLPPHRSRRTPPPSPAPPSRRCDASR